MTINGNFSKILKNINTNTVKQGQNHSNAKQAAQVSENSNTGKSFAEILRETAKNNTAKNSITTNSIELRQKQLSNSGNISANGARELTFSKHAQQRLFQRNINIAPELMGRIEEAVKKASDKNIKNALVLTDDTAFIINVDNNVVVTTMNSNEMRDNIITNIDGTVIL